MQTPQKMMQKPWQKEKKRKFAYNAIGSHLIWIKHRTILVKQISTRIGCVFFFVCGSCSLWYRAVVVVVCPCCGLVSILRYIVPDSVSSRVWPETPSRVRKHWPEICVRFFFFLVSIWLKMTSRYQEITLYILVAALHLNKFDSIRFDSISCCVGFFLTRGFFLRSIFPWSV